MSQAFVPVYRSPRSSDCEERAFVLMAVGIDNAVGFDGEEFVLHVYAASVPQAMAHLRQYDAERSRPAPAPPPPPPVFPNAWIGCALYILVLVGVAVAIARGLWRLDAFDAGALDGSRVQAGDWWRAITALTLHVDAAHLALNLGAGTWFGWLAGRQLGVGHAWLLIVAGAAFANLLEAWIGAGSHRAVGASTAVFAALGLIAAHSWQERFALPQRWARRWGPLIAGVILLGWMGSSGENTDLVGHAGGFVLGTLLGAIAALPATRTGLKRVPQWVAGAAALGAIVLAWTCALAS